jgi:hypothetical protein
VTPPRSPPHLPALRFGRPSPEPNQLVICERVSRHRRSVYLLWVVHGFTWLDDHLADGHRHPAYHPHAKVTATTNPALTPPTCMPTTQPVNCGGLPVGPRVGPPPAACSGLP